MTEESKTADSLPTRMTIFRLKDAPTLEETNCLELADVSPLVNGYLNKLVEAGIGHGGETKVLFDFPGFSLVYAWFKADFPLPLHTHDAHCLYCIIAGSLHLGTETLGTGDGFFVPKDAAYTYTPGSNGVELLEFRHAGHFNMKFLTNTAPFWEKAVERVRAEAPAWSVAKKPHLAEVS